MTAEESSELGEHSEAGKPEESFWGLSKQLAGRGAKGVGRAYDKTKSAVTQEAAWTEVGATVDTLVDVVCAEHAMILDLLDRVASLEAAAQPSDES